ncbi:MAG TPA: alpha-amylase family protein [Bryobacteraceae bacterium]|nr:alpha-amylase family protein [Bryobacteraceae bacterium]
MELSRRNFLLTGTALPAFAAAQTAHAATPWYQSMRRCGQVNFNERDPLTLDIPQWVSFWNSMKLDALLLNAGGIVAFYPTKIPYHHRSQFLGDRDLFGDFTKAAKARGIRVVARLDCNLAYDEALQAHPEWFQRRADGSPIRHAESPQLYQTCMFTSYFTEQIPAIIHEVNSLYDVDGFFTNGWPGTGRPGPCFCDACRRLADRRSPEFAEQHIERVLAVWKLWDAAAKQKKWDSVYVGNLGGGIRITTDVNRLASVAGWFNADHQGRSGNTPIWDCAQQGRVAQSVMKGRTITNVTGSYANTHPLWRHTAKAAAEATMWMAQTTASGMVPWYHWLGGTPQDQRWRTPGRDFFQWIAKYEPHFVNHRSIANIAVVFGQRTHSLYHAPGGGDSSEFLQGMYYALLEKRLFFDFVHEDDLSPETLRKYSVLVLPNVAVLSAAQCAQLRAFAQSGGSLLATFETARYDEKGTRRSELGLADVFRASVAGDIQGPHGNSYYAQIERRHAILAGFQGTNVLPGAEYRLPVKTQDAQIMTVIPPYPAYPPEMVYPRVPHTDEPAIVMTESGASRRIWIPGDIERSAWRSGDTDLSQLLGQSIAWLAHNSSPVTVSGKGLVEMFAWETEPGFAVHILNYTNPNFAKGWFHENYAIGPQRVTMQLPQGAKVKEVRLLRAETNVKHTLESGTLEFTIPEVQDYEIAAITRA